MGQKKRMKFRMAGLSRHWKRWKKEYFLLTRLTIKKVSLVWVQRSSRTDQNRIPAVHIYWHIHIVPGDTAYLGSPMCSLISQLVLRIWCFYREDDVRYLENQKFSLYMLFDNSAWERRYANWHTLDNNIFYAFFCLLDIDSCLSYKFSNLLFILLPSLCLILRYFLWCPQLGPGSRLDFVFDCKIGRDDFSYLGFNKLTLCFIL